MESPLNHQTRVYDSILELLSSVENPTPLVRLHRVVPHRRAEIYAKLEWYNPFGAIKDRVAANLVRDAEARGQLSAGARLVEPTSGNTGIGLVMIANAKGYKLTATLSTKIPAEKRASLRLFGSELVELEDDLCPAPGAPEGAIALAAEIGARPGHHHPNQYKNPANPDAHYRTTGPEIWHQTHGRITHFVAGLGTCGTITGTGRFLKERRSGVKVLGVHPAEGHDIPGVRSIRQLKQTALFFPNEYDGLIEVHDEAAFELCRRLNQEESIIAGPSSGMALAGALEGIPDEEGVVCVVIFPDNAFKYASSIRRHLPELFAGAKPDGAQVSANFENIVEFAHNSPDLIGVDEARGLLTASGALHIIDVSSPAEYEQGHLPSAINVPLPDLAGGYATALPGDFGAPILSVCRAGERSVHGMILLKALGYQRVKSLRGGLNAWVAAGLSAETGPRPVRANGYEVSAEVSRAVRIENADQETSVPEQLSTELDQLAARINQVLDGTLDPEMLKAERVPMGVYQHRQPGVFMVRIRCPGGRIEPDQLARVAALASTHAARLHVTTRQETQLHGVSLSDVAPILKSLLEVGLVTKGAGGNTIRNITASPSESPQSDTGIDVAAYAVALTEWFLFDSPPRSLPRKLKMAFANDTNDDVGARFNDLGFIAKTESGVAGFEVRVAGGLGTRPRVSSVVHPFIPAMDVHVVAEAVVRLFEKYGNRQNRNLARLRFLWEELGEDEFTARYREELQQVRASSPAALTIKASAEDVETEPAPAAASANSEELATWRRRYVRAQRRHDRFEVLIPVQSGDLDSEQARIIARIAGGLGRDSLRFTTSQNVLLRHVPEAWLQAIYTQLSPLFPLMKQPLVMAEGVACAGAGTCQLGICLSKNVLRAVRDALQGTTDFDIDAAHGARIHVSGCPNNCGRHSVADLGFFGKAMRVGDRLLPAYRVVAGARRGPEPRLAEEMGNVHARHVPDLAVDALRAFSTGRLHGENFEAWFEREGRDLIRELVRTHSARPIPATDRALDWGAEEHFSLVGRGAGECSAGP